ncbi:MAG: hypothetical protein HYS12_11835, partial [Planctomycetes bacterium]|nr:hypothetical protein [Planctomycetota bacterium]
MPLRVVFVLALLALAAPAAAQPPARLQKVDKAPVLRVEAGGPTAAVTALAFSPDGQRLYAAGLDKVVRTWDFDQGQYRLGRTSYRVPLGPALNGAVNALALSPDGKWLAVGGMSVYRGQFGFREFGYAIPTEGKMDDEMLEDQGRIYLFDTDDGSARELRGHRGQVFALAFAPKRAGKPPLLASVAVQASGKSEVGIDLRLWNVEEAASLAQQRGLSLDMRKLVRPGLAVEHTGDAPRAVRVAVALNDGAFRAWEPDRERLVPAQSDTATAAFLPEEGSVLTAPRGEHTPSLELWRVSDGKASWVQGARARGNNSTAYATALALVSSRPGGPPDYVAVVARLPRRDDERRLQLFKLTGDDFGAVKADLFLWNDSKQPVLATTAQGEYLAVAGNRDHEILVYRIKDLLDGRAEPQRLRGIGTTFRRVAFA